MRYASIGIDARPLTGTLTGIGRYVLDLCHRMDATMPHASFYAYTPYPPSVPLPSSRWHVRLPTRVPAHLGGYFWFKFLSPQLIEADGLDWFFGTRTLLPKLTPGTRTVSLVHDLNHVLAPSTMTPLNRLAHALWFKRDVLRATHVVANSGATAARLLSYCGRQADAVVSPSVAQHFVPATPGGIARVRDHFGLSGPYLLSVATLEPRKNIASLIEAFLSLRRDGALPGHSLALAGAAGWGQDPLARRLRQGIPGVVALGYVDDADLPALYSGADAFVFPSLYEGFGIPVAEALACGTRVIATDLPELRESTQGQATFVAPDPVSIAKGIVEGLGGPRPEYAPPAPDDQTLAALFSARAGPSTRR